MSCDGPDNQKWDSYFNTCVSGNQTSCDTVTQTTCYYAYVALADEKPGWFGGKLVDGGLKVYCLPESMANLGIEIGDIIHTLNGSVVCEHNITQFTEQRPALLADVFRYHASRFSQWRVHLDLRQVRRD